MWKNPSVITSKLWQECCEKKKTKGEQQENNENKIKRLREKKKNKKEELMHDKNKKLHKEVKTDYKAWNTCLNLMTNRIHGWNKWCCMYWFRWRFWSVKNFRPRNVEI